MKQSLFITTPTLKATKYFTTYVSTLKDHASLPAEMCYGEQRVTDDL